MSVCDSIGVRVEQPICTLNDGVCIVVGDVDADDDGEVESDHKP